MNLFFSGEMASNDQLQQCLDASKESLIEIDPNGELIQRQLWKISGTKLINKANIWHSEDEWKFKPVKKENGKIYIEKTSSNQDVKVLETTDNHILVEEAFDEQNAKQKWKKGPVSGEDFFTLENVSSQKFLTANSTDKLILKGN